MTHAVDLPNGDFLFQFGSGNPAHDQKAELSSVRIDPPSI
jgi:hypothetical protein